MDLFLRSVCLSVCFVVVSWFGCSKADDSSLSSDSGTSTNLECKDSKGKCGKTGYSNNSFNLTFVDPQEQFIEEINRDLREEKALNTNEEVVEVKYLDKVKTVLCAGYNPDDETGHNNSDASFKIHINGEDYGIFNLNNSDKPFSSSPLYSSTFKYQMVDNNKNTKTQVDSFINSKGETVSGLYFYRASDGKETNKKRNLGRVIYQNDDSTYYKGEENSKTDKGLAVRSATVTKELDIDPTIGLSLAMECSYPKQYKSGEAQTQENVVYSGCQEDEKFFGRVNLRTTFSVLIKNKKTGSTKTKSIYGYGSFEPKAYLPSGFSKLASMYGYGASEVIPSKFSTNINFGPTCEFLKGSSRKEVGSFIPMRKVEKNDDSLSFNYENEQYQAVNDYLTKVAEEKPKASVNLIYLLSNYLKENKLIEEHEVIDLDKSNFKSMPTTVCIARSPSEHTSSSSALFKFKFNNDEYDVNLNNYIKSQSLCPEYGPSYNFGNIVKDSSGSPVGVAPGNTDGPFYVLGGKFSKNINMEEGLNLGMSCSIDECVEPGLMMPDGTRKPDIRHSGCDEHAEFYEFGKINVISKVELSIKNVITGKTRIQKLWAYGTANLKLEPGSISSFVEQAYTPEYFDTNEVRFGTGKPICSFVHSGKNEYSVPEILIHDEKECELEIDDMNNQLENMGYSGSGEGFKDPRGYEFSASGVKIPASASSGGYPRIQSIDLGGGETVIVEIDASGNVSCSKKNVDPFICTRTKTSSTTTGGTKCLQICSFDLAGQCTPVDTICAGSGNEVSVWHNPKFPPRLPRPDVFPVAKGICKAPASKEDSRIKVEINTACACGDTNCWNEKIEKSVGNAVGCAETTGKLAGGVWGAAVGVYSFINDLYALNDEIVNEDVFELIKRVVDQKNKQDHNGSDQEYTCLSNMMSLIKTIEKFDLGPLKKLGSVEKDSCSLDLSKQIGTVFNLVTSISNMISQVAACANDIAVGIEKIDKKIPDFFKKVTTTLNKLMEKFKIIKCAWDTIDNAKLMCDLVKCSYNDIINLQKSTERLIRQLQTIEESGIDDDPTDGECLGENVDKVNSSDPHCAPFVMNYIGRVYSSRIHKELNTAKAVTTRFLPLISYIPYASELGRRCANACTEQPRVESILDSLGGDCKRLKSPLSCSTSPDSCLVGCCAVTQGDYCLSAAYLILQPDDNKIQPGPYMSPGTGL